MVDILKIPYNILSTVDNTHFVAADFSVKDFQPITSSFNCIILDDAIYLDCNKMYPTSHQYSGSDIKSVNLECGKRCCFKR